MKKHLLIIVLLAGCLVASHAHAAVSFNSSSTAIFNGFTAGKTVTSTLSVSSNSNRVVIQCVSIWQDVAGTGSVSSATFQGSNMTKAISTRQSNIAVEAWYFVNPTSGTQSATTTITGNIDAVKTVWMQFDGVDQITPIEASSTGVGATISATTTITTVNANAVIGECISKFGTETLTARTGQTQVYNDKTGSVDGAGSYKSAASPGSQTVGWTWTTTAQNWSEAAVSLKPAVVAASTRRRFPGVAR